MSNSCNFLIRLSRRSNKWLQIFSYFFIFKTFSRLFVQWKALPSKTVQTVQKKGDLFLKICLIWIILHVGHQVWRRPDDHQAVVDCSLRDHRKQSQQSYRHRHRVLNWTVKSEDQPRDPDKPYSGVSRSLLYSSLCILYNITVCMSCKHVNMFHRIFINMLTIQTTKIVFRNWNFNLNYFTTFLVWYLF